MSTKKLRVEIKRTDVYTIQFDENIINKAWMADFAKHFYNAGSLEKLAEQLAFSIINNGSNTAFHEGFGNVAMFENGEQIRHYAGDKKILAKDYTAGIIVHILDENEDFEYETTEVKQ